MPRLSINGHPQQVDVDPDTPLLWVLRDTLGLTGTRYGCGIAQCGACTVHIDGVATRSCSVPVSTAEGAQITTIEGLSPNGGLHPVQKAWIAHDVPQCGYCQSGNDHGRGGASQGETAADRRRHRRGDHQHLPLRHLCADPRGDPHRRRGVTVRRWPMTYMPQLSRRSFVASVAALGGGLALGFHLPTGAGPARAAGGTAEVNAWVVIQPDDAVVIRVARSEMGQGITTALPMLVAEELECDWHKVRAEFPTADENLRRHRAWGDMSTGGSRSVRSSQEYLRKAGAAAREMLVAAAAQQWSVPAVECQAAKSIITHKPSGRTLRFGEVVEAAAKLPLPAEPKLKDPKDWTLVGTPQKRLDTMDKVTGKPIFGIDVRVPNMLYAAIAQCPVFGGTPKSYDEAKIRDLKGVRRIVKLPNAVAVVADSWWQAKHAIDVLPVTWDEGQNGKVSSASIAELLRSGLSAPEAAVVRKDGDIEAALTTATNRIEAEYDAPYLAHA